MSRNLLTREGRHLPEVGTTVRYHTVEVDGIKIFYREARSARCARTPPVTSVPEGESYVQRLNPVPRGTLSIVGARLAWLPAVGHAVARHVQQFGSSDRSVHGTCQSD